MLLRAFALVTSWLATHAAALQQLSEFALDLDKLVPAQPNSQLVPRASRGPKRVHLHVSRHGMSCSNAMMVFYQQGTQKAMLDPMLTDCGVHRSTVAGKRVKALGLKPDLVLSSAMMRSMETALYQYPHSEIIAVPYAGEPWPGKDNRPRALNQQEEFLSKRHDMNLLNFKYLKQANYSGNSARVGGDFTKLTNFLANDLLSKIPDGLKDKEDLDVALVSHSIFMARIQAIKQLCHVTQVENNQVLKISFDYDPGQKTLDVYRCEKFFPGLSYHSTGFCQHDFGEVCEAEVHAAFPKNQSMGIFNGSSPEQMLHPRKKGLAECCLAEHHDHKVPKE